MNRDDFKEQDDLEAFLRTLAREKRDLTFTDEMQARVLKRIEERTPPVTARIASQKRKLFGRRAWVGIGAAAVACVAWVLIATGLINNRIFTINSSFHTASTGAGIPSFSASLAPVDVAQVSVLPTTAQTTNHGVPGVPRTNGIMSLAPQSVTVHATLVNQSDRPIAGKDLQGMLFILKNSSGLSPLQWGDWEYFVNGPSGVIPAHGSLPWSFTPNPTPPFTSLASRQVHMIWMFRKGVQNAPTLTIGTLPIATQVQSVVVTGRVQSVQFFTVNVTARNESQRAIALNHVMGILIFGKGEPLLSRSTYKYFDDVTHSAKMEWLKPGQSRILSFTLTGVPGVEMQKLSSHVFLVARSQLGV
ncbi:hypothetical protein [Ferroacidibacillus organovorans]|uniref:Uncharacterized protein n=1 Tax=Ferroacidibacillus organovorans TaxID=1765683 RepID=A0A162TXK5_9BACL|nr:hypothetical protein [Ferroacidibacillus organovorans]KYP81219.1 hypothetical protein AYJ22_08275 [Ferroacidibacillus organovorans]OAG93918.1 hypothetical protein AYW79_08245 [Ferroacidibacillus organovorans]OPG17697.1 hypothetical protein B2M26_00690 [Ferroacidibacillus organovorans]